MTVVKTSTRLIGTFWEMFHVTQSRLPTDCDSSTCICDIYSSDTCRRTSGVSKNHQKTLVVCLQLNSPLDRNACFLRTTDATVRSRFKSSFAMFSRCVIRQLKEFSRIKNSCDISSLMMAKLHRPSSIFSPDNSPATSVGKA